MLYYIMLYAILLHYIILLQSIICTGFASAADRKVSSRDRMLGMLGYETIEIRECWSIWEINRIAKSAAVIEFGNLGLRDHRSTHYSRWCRLRRREFANQGRGILQVASWGRWRATPEHDHGYYFYYFYYYYYHYY